MTVYHKAMEALRRVLPQRVARSIRALATSVVTPCRWSYQTGHFRSSIGGRAVDRSGNPVPWYTYPAIDFLSAKDFSSRDVLEFGAGQSTLWWALRSRSVVSVEDDEGWFRQLKDVIPSTVDLRLSGRDPAGVVDEEFDVIVIDGLDRFLCAVLATKLMRPGGCIVLDNSDGYWGPDERYVILSLMRQDGFSRIDFYGYAPGVILPHCTSLFFKESCFLLSGTEDVVRRT